MNQAVPGTAGAVESEAPGIVLLGNLQLNLDNYRVSVEGRHIELTYREFELLRLLAAHADRVVPYDLLTTGVWGVTGRRTLRHLNVIVHGLRAKLTQSCPYAIETVRGRGYGLLKARSRPNASSNGRDREQAAG